MEWSEFELHSARRQVKKIIQHLLDVRKALYLAHKPAKLTGAHNQTTAAIESNILALLEGTTETITLCAHAAEDFKSRMKDPDDRPPPEHAGVYPIRLTPFQRALEKEGVSFSKDTYMPQTKSTKPPRILPFRLVHIKRKNRRSSPDNPPL